MCREKQQGSRYKTSKKGKCDTVYTISATNWGKTKSNKIECCSSLSFHNITKPQVLRIILRLQIVVPHCTTTTAMLSDGCLTSHCFCVLLCVRVYSSQQYCYCGCSRKEWEVKRKKLTVALCHTTTYTPLRISYIISSLGIISRT